jgi:hypothetical protein
MVFYLGSNERLPLIPYDLEHPAFNSKELDESEMTVKRHFTTPYITYVGSDTGCGCEFRYAQKEQDGWIPVVGEDEMNDKNIQNNQEALYNYIKTYVTEGSVELYGCWDGDYNEQAESREEIAIEDILDKDIFFKERGFYSIYIGG